MALTPEQFNKLATKEELREVKNDTAEIKENVQKLLTSIDGLSKNVSDIEHAFVSNIAAHDRFEERIIRLEKALKIQSV